MVTPAALVDELAAGESAGSALPRRALADVVAGCRSAPECELRDLVRTSRILPDARWNRPLPGASGLVPDACWPEARLIVEIDSAGGTGLAMRRSGPSGGGLASRPSAGW